MYNITSIAIEVLNGTSMTQKKLQKIVYYIQALYLAKFKCPLIDAYFEAWVHGPVSPELYQSYKKFGWKEIPQTNGSKMISVKDKKFINQVKNYFISYDANELERMTHSETPWLEARGQTPDHEPSNEKISNNCMIEYYKNHDFFN